VAVWKQADKARKIIEVTYFTDEARKAPGWKENGQTVG